MRNTWIWAGMVAAVGMAALASGQGLPAGPMPTPTVNVGPVAAAKAANPAPSAAAKNQGQKAGIGTGRLGESFRAVGVLDGHGGP